MTLNVLQLNYNDTGSAYPTFQQFLSVDSSMSVDAEIIVELFRREPRYQPDGIDGVALLGPFSDLEMRAIMGTRDRHIRPNEEDLYSVRLYYAEGIERENVRRGIIRIIPEDPVSIDFVDLYRGKRFIKRFSPGETKYRPKNKFFSRTIS
tara:strand:- start:24012 stop:24461 length:450 start_codon:yes stop_codon:yes gene_type:complete